MFVALVEEGTPKGAARCVSRSQPALSMAIKRLEQEMGSPLFDPEKHNDYLLTPEGAMLYCYALRLVRIYEKAVIAMNRLRENPRKTPSSKPRSVPTKARTDRDSAK